MSVIVFERDELNSNKFKYKYISMTTLIVVVVYVLFHSVLSDFYALIWLSVALSYITYAYLQLDRYINFRICISECIISLVFDDDVETFKLEDVTSIVKTSNGFKIKVNITYGMRINTDKRWFRINKTYKIDTEYISNDNKLLLESYFEGKLNYGKQH